MPLTIKDRACNYLACK